MEYIVGKTYKKLGIDQNFDLTKGASAFEENLFNADIAAVLCTLEEAVLSSFRSVVSG